MASSRHEARKQALDILYEADLRDSDLEAVLAHHREGETPPSAFTVQLVAGVAAHREELDVLISAHARDWKLSRMPIIDRNLLRLGLSEILHSEVPTPVAINEAVQLAKEYSTDDSGRFVNGILARIAEAHPTP